MESWIKQLLPIIEEYKDGDDSPLDGDSVEVLVNIIRGKINLQEGNITKEEYENELDDRAIHIVSNSNRDWDSMVEKAMIFLSMDDPKEVKRILQEIDADANICDGDLLNEIHDDLVISERFENSFTVGDFFLTIT